MILYKYLSGEKVKNSKSVVIIVPFELPQYRKKISLLMHYRNLKIYARKTERNALIETFPATCQKT